MARVIKEKGELPQEFIDNAVNESLYWYKNNVSEDSLSGGKLNTEQGKRFAYAEQQAMIEALIRAWAYVEAPRIINRFRVIKVENDVCFPIGSNGVYLESRADMILAEDKDYFPYSLKTCKEYTSWMMKSFLHDLQGITESWSTERWFEDRNRLRFHLGKKKIYPNRVTGVRFCFLVKGDRKEGTNADGSPNGVWFTYNPFIRGYKNEQGTKTRYAHSWFFETKKGNKSGRDALGKGWVPFFVWEGYEGGVRQWMADIWDGKIQSDYCSTGEGHREIFYEHVIVPTPIFRQESEIKTTLIEISSQEEEVFDRAKSLESFKDEPDQYLENMARWFPRRRGSCFYPQECDFTPICWGDTAKGGCDLDNAVDSGLYQIRIPHHTREKALLEEKYASKTT